MNLRFIPALVLIVSVVSCETPSINTNKSGEDIFKEKSMTQQRLSPFTDTVYVPIYSDIYSKTKDTKLLLTATLSIRNTSLTDSMYINAIDYYDSDGILIKSHIGNSLVLSPMQSIEYVVDEEDKTGGTGANYIIAWGADNTSLKPIFQGVMVSITGQQGVSFLTEGVSIRAE